MANPNDPNDPNDQTSNVNIINQPNQPMVQANQPVQARQRGTGFTNINRILGANVGAGQQLATRIGGAIGGQAERVRQNLGQTQQQFQTGFQQARQQALANIGAASGLARQPGESDEQYESRIASQSPDYSQVGQNLRTAAYSGPTGFQNPNVLLSQAQSAGRLGTFTGSGLGQGILARQYAAGRGNYGIGQNVLDQLFLSQDPAAQQMLRQARQGVTGLGREIAEASSAATQAAQAATGGIEQEKAKAFTGLEQSARGIQERGAQAAKQFYVDRDRFNQLLTAKKETDEQGNVRYRDSSGNLLNLTDRDYQLINTPQQFGLNTSDIHLDETPPNVTQGVLNQIVNSGITTNIGSLKYTPEQEIAAKNLAALRGVSAEPYSSFETDVFNPDMQKIAESLNSESLSQLNKSEAERQQYIDQKKIQEARNLWENYKHEFTYALGYKPDYSGRLRSLGATEDLSSAKDLDVLYDSIKNTINSLKQLQSNKPNATVRDQRRRRRYVPVAERIATYEQLLANSQPNVPSHITLQNYLNRLYNRGNA